jgi:hypothetical protein
MKLSTSPLWEHTTRTDHFSTGGRERVSVEKVVEPAHSPMRTGRLDQPGVLVRGSSQEAVVVLSVALAGAGVDSFLVSGVEAGVEAELDVRESVA